MILSELPNIISKKNLLIYSTFSLASVIYSFNKLLIFLSLAITLMV